MVQAVHMSRVIHLPVMRGRSVSGPCAVCSVAAGRPYFMTHGVVVALCKAHREMSYLRRRSGRVFGDQLRHHFISKYGSVSARQNAAIQTHVDCVYGIDLTSGPGSYAWPTVRLEAEQRFASGEDPRVVIAQLRRRYSGTPAIVPSVRTLQRWFAQGRWLVDPPLWRQVRRNGSRRRNRRVIEYLGGSRLEEAIFHPTLAWARKLNPGFSIEHSFSMRA